MVGHGFYSGTGFAQAEKYTEQWVSGVLTQLFIAAASACIFVGRLALVRRVSPTIMATQLFFALINVWQVVPPWAAQSLMAVISACSWVRISPDLPTIGLTSSMAMDVHLAVQRGPTKLSDGPGWGDPLFMGTQDRQPFPCCGT